MEKSSVAVLLSLLYTTLSAQNWCPPGATWTYGLQASWGEGYYELTYVGDTLLGGLIGQNINSRQHFYFNDVDSVIDGQSIYYTTTRRDTDIVWWWEPTLLTWDTLYWFGAVQGEKWLPPNYVGVCPPNEWIEVVDTGTAIISGVSLRYCDIMQAGEFDSAYSRITERLGWEWEMNIWPPCAYLEGPLGLRCYSDAQISWSDPDWSYGCHSIVGMDHIGQAGMPIPFPDPGSDHFALDLRNGLRSIELYDMSGAPVLREQLMGDVARVTTTTLAQGMYMYRLRSDDGKTVSQGKWIKE